MSASSFSEHLDAFRKTLFYVVLIITCGFMAAFTYSNEIIDYLAGPLKPSNQELSITPIQTLEITNTTNKDIWHEGEVIAPKETKRIEKRGTNLHIFSPAEGLIISLKIALWTAFLFTAPFWIIPILLFILPALHAHERRIIAPFFLTLATFLILGIWMAVKFTLPITNSYFLEYNRELGTNLWGLSNYLDYTLTLIFAHGVGFELIGALFLLVHYHLIDIEFLRSKRRHAIVISLILGALLTPPDILSQLMVAVPLYIGYELIVLYGFLRNRTKVPILN